MSDAIPKGFIGGGYNQAIGRMIASYSDPRISESAGENIVNVISVTEIEVICLGNGVRGHWIDVTEAWNTSELCGSIRAFTRSIRDARLYCDPFLPCSSCICLLNSLFTLVEYSETFHFKLLSRSKVLEQSFINGEPLSGSWLVAAKHAPTLWTRIKMDRAFFPDEEFDSQVITQQLPQQMEGIQSVFENAVREQMLQMQASDRL